MKKISTLFAFLLMGVLTAFAQTEQNEQVSNEELKQFASAFQEIQSVDRKAQEDMMKAVEDKGLDVQRYNEIQQSTQDPNQEAKASGEEMKQYETASQELETIQTKAQQQMQEKIVDEGLTVDRYQEIAVMVQNDPELQQKLQEYMQG